MYHNISSCVINNGYSSIFFPLTKGVRQGCPLSSLLFVMVVETLAIQIRNNKNIRGVKFNDNEIKISLLADDTTIFTNDVDSLQETMRIMNLFKNLSGLKINQTKTNVLQVGNLKWNIKKLRLKEVEEIYSLGTWFYKDQNRINDYNLNEKYKLFEGVLHFWKSKNINTLERIKVVKTYALSKIHFTLSSLTTPNQFIDKIQKSINEFIWNYKKPKIKQEVAYNNIQMGGLSIPNVKKFVQANRVMWIKRLLDTKNRSMQYLSIYLPMLPFLHFIKCNISPDDLPHTIPSFYREVLYAWLNIKIEPHNALDVRQEYIHFNKFIKIDNKPINIPSLREHNIYMINNFFDNEGKPIKYKSFCDLYGNLISEFKYISLIDAIPANWRNLLKQQNTNDTTNILDINQNPTLYVNKNLKDINNTKSREVYWTLINKNEKTPTCIESWKKESLDFGTKQWESIFILPFRSVSDIKIRELQLKIIHRFYPSQCLVSKWDKDVDEICYLCHTDVANTSHTFSECKVIIEFWNSLSDVIAPILSLYSASLNSKQILFGIIPYTLGNHCINHCILHGKNYIHLERMQSRKPALNKFINYYKDILEIDRIAYLLKNEKMLFDKLFNRIKILLV